MATKAPRTDGRVLNYGTGPPKDGLEREWDTCPDCGSPRWQLIIVPDCFHCDRCEKASVRNDEPPPPPEPEQIDLFKPTEPEVIPLDPKAREVADRARDVLAQATDESAPIDEGMAWVAEEMPDE